MLECFPSATCFCLIALSGVLVVFWFYLWLCFLSPSPCVHPSSLRLHYLNDFNVTLRAWDMFMNHAATGCVSVSKMRSIFQLTDFNSFIFFVLLCGLQGLYSHIQYTRLKATKHSQKVTKSKTHRLSFTLKPLSTIL